MRPSARLSIVIGILVAFVTGSVLAHIPASSWLMGRMTHKREKTGVRRIKVQMTCGLTEQERKPEVLYLRVPRMVRRERSDGTVDVCNQDRCVRRRQGAQIERLPAWTMFQYLYFVEGPSTGDRWVRLLKALKIDTKVDTLTRSGSRVAIVLGAKEWERDRPQIWIDKLRYVPLRLMLRAGQSLVDIGWLDWGGRITGDWFPARMEVRQDGKLVEACTVDHVDVNASISEDLFKLD
jgi:hypothetical protein